MYLWYGIIKYISLVVLNDQFSQMLSHDTKYNIKSHYRMDLLLFTLLPKVVMFKYWEYWLTVEQNLIFLIRWVTLMYVVYKFNLFYLSVCGYQNLYCPLHLAAKSGHIEAIETLVKAGADINAVNNKVWWTFCCTYMYSYIVSVLYHYDRINGLLYMWL